MSFLFRYEVFKVLYTSNSTGSHGFAVRSRAFALSAPSVKPIRKQASVCVFLQDPARLIAYVKAVLPAIRPGHFRGRFSSRAKQEK